MKFVTRRRIGTTRLLAALIVGATAFVLPGLMAPAQAYPTASCSVSAPTHPVKPGHKFAVSGKSPIVESWSASFNGTTKKFHAKNFATDFTAPTKGHYTLSVSCSGAAGAQTLAFSIDVAGASSGGGGKLPNTGGPDLWWFIAGGGAVVLGSALVIRRRRTVSP